MTDLAVLLGMAPFVHMPTTFRTLFYAAPGQAVLVACALCLAGHLLGRRAGGVAVAVTVGLLVAHTTREGLRDQDRVAM